MDLSTPVPTKYMGEENESKYDGSESYLSTKLVIGVLIYRLINSQWWLIPPPESKELPVNVSVPK